MTTHSMNANQNAADRAWLDGIQKVNDEAAGLMDVTIIDADAGREMLVDAALGNYEAAIMLQAVRQAAARIKQAPRNKPALCICCPRAIRRLTPGTVFGLAVPATASPSGAIGFVFCDRCAVDRSTLAAKATRGLRRIWPGLRPVEITHSTGGRA